MATFIKHIFHANSSCWLSRFPSGKQPVSIFTMPGCLSTIKPHRCVVWPKKLGACNRQVYFTGVKKTPFSRICSSTLLEQKLTKFSVWIPLRWGTSMQFQIRAKSAKLFRYAPSKFVLFSSYFSSPSFRNTFSNRYNSRVLKWISLKFGALLEHIRAYLRFNFYSNGIKKHRVTINFQNFQV